MVADSRASVWSDRPGDSWRHPGRTAGDLWRSTPAEHAARDRWKRASRAVILRIVLRLEERGFSMGDLAEIWDASVGAQWFPGLVNLAMRERQVVHA